MEHYDAKDRLHCYEENSQGPCEDGKIFVQPDEEDENGVLKDPVCSTHFEIKGGGFSNMFFRTCKKGSKFDPTTRKCRRICNLKCLRQKHRPQIPLKGLKGLHQKPPKRRLGSLKTRIGGCSNPRGCG